MGAIKDRPKTWQFTFNSNKGEHIFNYDPLEWAKTEYGLDRDEDGMYFTFSGDYTYFKAPYDYLKAGLDTYGVLWECTLTIKYISTYTHAYVALLTDKLLDFASVDSGSNENGNTIKIPLKDSGFYSKLLTYESDEIAYSNLETLAGDEITPYDDEYEEVTVYGQETITTANGTGDDYVYSKAGGYINFTPYISFESNNTNVKTVQFHDQTSYPGLVNLSLADMFFTATENTVINIDFSFHWIVGGTNETHIYLNKLSYDSETGVFTDLGRIYSSPYYSGGENTTVIQLDVTLLEGEMLWFNGATYNIDNFTSYSDSILTLDIMEKAPTTKANLVSLLHVHDRLITSITGQADSFQSSVFEEGGKWAHIFAGNGYLFRGFTTDEAQLSFNYKELKENCSKLLGVAYGMIEVEGKKIIICEDKDYFYQDEVVCIVKKIKQHSFTRKPDMSQYYSAVSVGVPKKDYEQESGLIDYTTAANYTTILSIFENELDLECSYFTSGNWVEFARRLAKSDTETTDSKFDNDICLFETILEDGVRVQRTTEDFETITGIDKITTPINLNLTPARSLKRWGKWLKVGLQKYLTSYVKFGTSEILTTLSTLRTDESIEVFENTDILANNLDDRKLTGDIISVLCDVTAIDIANTQANPTGKWQLTDEETGETIQMWIKSISTIPIGESLTNIEGYEAADISEIDNSILWVSGESIDWVSGESIDWNGV